MCCNRSESLSKERYLSVESVAVVVVVTLLFVLIQSPTATGQLVG